MMPETTKERMLQEYIASLGSACVAYSGGIDSTLLVHVAHEVLGNRMLAITVASPLLPERDIIAATATANRLGVPHTLLSLDPLADPRICQNTRERCYWCKKLVMTEIRACAQAHGITEVMDGANADDLHEDRPGIKAVRECGVRSPLQEIGFTKKEIRELARRRGIEIWNRPPQACLATRIPYGTPLTHDALARVAAAEEFLIGYGFSQVRVRHYGMLARIEVPEDDIPRLAAPTVRHDTVTGLQRLGYIYITLDLGGYRSGSMLEANVSAHQQEPGRMR
ncbi:MAG: ATP-dependent sacrificial sulfur transferase LarE [Desulfobacterota bacterium]|nr:ATP-dependent sacrificial sulfur transferase LarE [Thermodesulfobacteriota bacterium]